MNRALKTGTNLCGAKKYMMANMPQIIWSEIGSGFGEPGGTPPPRYNPPYVGAGFLSIPPWGVMFH